MAKRLGITHNVPPYLSITLGTDEATPLDMTTVYNTLSTGGIRHDPVFVTKVVGQDGETIFEQKYTGTRVLNENVALTVDDMLRGVISSGTGTGARIPGHDAVGKTGTTNEYGDAWFCGMTMKYTSCVWMGDPSARTPMRSVGGRTVFGGTYPASIWRTFMVAAVANQPNVKFPSPNESLWPKGKYITDLGRGKGVPPISEGFLDPTDPRAAEESTTTTVGTLPFVTSPVTTTVPESTTTTP
jgi:penicillin-binding protein 1A